jgi:superoxide dismutase, Fe-Mn family
MSYTQKDYSKLIGIPGLGSQLLNNHFTLYNGYVANTNKLLDSLKELGIAGKSATPEYAEMNRRLGWEFNGMRLHEYYFENLCAGSRGINRDSALFKQIEKDFARFENWDKCVRAAAAMRGIGWVVTYYDTIAGSLFNVWINEHDAGHFAGCVPILVMDVFEHAYMLDYGIKRADYIEAFFKIIDWEMAERRFSQAQG